MRNLRRLGEYIKGVTLARQSINILKPKVIAQMTGDVIEIGGYDSFFRQRYKNGRYQNLDIVASPDIDIVSNAEDMKEVASDALGGVICISVLEHTMNPEKVISEIYRCLKPGGKAFISSPWLFEGHMEPDDYHRFSHHTYQKFFSDFEMLDVDYTNSYFGLIAHIMQHNMFLRLIFGVGFFLADLITLNEPRWATQISYILKKPDK